MEGFSTIIFGIDEYVPPVVIVVVEILPWSTLQLATAFTSSNVLSIIIDGGPVYPLPAPFIIKLVMAASSVTVPLAVEFPDASSYLYSLSYKYVLSSLFVSPMPDKPL